MIMLHLTAGITELHEGTENGPAAKQPNTISSLKEVVHGRKKIRISII